MEFGKGDWKTFEQGIQKEWLLTNGIGGFASSTIIGANTRRYHGLLVASLKAPVQRHLILSKLDESIHVDGKSYNLYTNQTPDHIGDGYLHLQRFAIDGIPAFIYNVEDIFIEKKICMVYEENTVIVRYKILSSNRDCKLKVAPLINFRDYHYNSQSRNLQFNQRNTQDGVVLTPAYIDTDIFIESSEGKFIGQEGLFFYNMDYAVERERGLHSFEDHYIPGIFEIDVQAGVEKQITMTAGIGQSKKLDGNQVIEKEKQRIQALVKTAGYNDDFANQLVKAADQFIVYRESTQSKTIIAGYPWFTDWGRDTMIALPGLTLVTKRYHDAKNILYTFAQYIKHGLVPNVFPDGGEEPAYNTVDAPLWFINAAYKYLEYTDDADFIKEHIYDKLVQIIDAYIHGTIHNIKMDVDGLIEAGSEDTQLTWMDAKVGDWIVTPRHGKAVEINALWYNALNGMAYIAEKCGASEQRYLELASNIKKSFEEKFWNEQKKCLFDTINNQMADEKVRPNQILAVSLPFPVLEGKKAKQVVSVVFQQLYTAYGLRSLTPLDPQYKGIYYGDQYNRDGAYHQGTVWSWLIGPFITAFRKVHGYSDESKEICLKLIEPFQDHLKDACVGSVSEIFDGNPPHIARGCFAQAWGVAEVLRAYVEERLS
ncbi:amylo-alpha-1,6-glucosidase [Petroclostridium sp. X23]|uniref:amylo-alpha-1,6-glucosidase n=1 Tax=Petroclostridium sp. X23 TaxID=3045146 RepID=UPI0024AD5B0C|nr:amylo-alpha-1,6-glucosidase [Petroclostridium sp. X23]WHH60473.1 amylo-alpha-1,6-glucosidase [Petroclostridium sp. X23]